MTALSLLFTLISSLTVLSWPIVESVSDSSSACWSVIGVKFVPVKQSITRSYLVKLPELCVCSGSVLLAEMFVMFFLSYSCE